MATKIGEILLNSWLEENSWLDDLWVPHSMNNSPECFWVDEFCQICPIFGNIFQFLHRNEAKNGQSLPKSWVDE